MKKIGYSLLALLVVMAITIGVWEQYRDGMIRLFDSETIVYERPVEEATEYELYVASQEVQDELKLMFMKHQRKVLDDQIAKTENLQ